MTPILGAAILVGVWLLCSLGCGFLLALLARRMHPSLSLRRLWVFFSGLMGFTVAAVLAIAWW